MGSKRDYLRDFNAIDFEFCVWMWLLRVYDLLDGDRSKCIGAISTLAEMSPHVVHALTELANSSSSALAATL